MQRELLIQEFFIEGKKQKHGVHVLLHITEPTTPAEFVKGYFFALITIRGGSSEHITFIQELIDDIEAEYYSDGDSSFEELLESTNRRTRKLLSHISDIDCVVGVLQGKKLQLSYYGNPYVLLFYKKKGLLQPLSILEGTSEEPAKGKLFSSILEGSIGEEDVFFVGTPDVALSFDEQRLSTLVSSRPLSDTASHIEQVLKQLRSGISYGGIFFSFSQPAQPSQPAHGTKKSHPSAVSVMPRIPDPRRSIAPLPAQASSSPSTPTSDSSSFPSVATRSRGESVWAIILVAIGKGLLGLLFMIFRGCKRIGVRIGKMTVGTIVLITNHGNNRQTVIYATKQWFADKRLSFRSLPLLSKILFFATIIIVAIFIGSIWYLRIQEQREAQEAAYQNTLAAIVNKKDAADAAIIYGDDERAVELLQEATALIAALPNTTEEEQSKRMEFEQQISASLQKLQKISLVSPTLLTKLTDANPMAEVSSLALINDTILAYGPNDALAYRVDALTKQIQTTTHDNIPNIRISTTPKENDAIAFIYSDSNLAFYSPDTTAITTADIAYPLPTDGVVSRINAIGIYNQRLYSVDTVHNMIYRHAKTQTGFDRGTPWISGSANVQDAVAIAIDGDVYVLTTSSLLKFTGGAQQSFSIIGLDPMLDRPTAIYTYADVPYIYILEPTHKRVIVLTKEGKLVAQYTANEWNNPTGMVVDTERNSIYVLDSNSIYTIPTPQ